MEQAGRLLYGAAPAAAQALGTMFAYGYTSGKRTTSPRTGAIAMKLASLQDLFVDQLKDLYSAESQLIKALPKMAKAANNPELRAGFEEHLEQTREHAARLEQICEELDVTPKGK